MTERRLPDAVIEEYLRGFEALVEDLDNPAVESTLGANACGRLP